MGNHRSTSFDSGTNSYSRNSNILNNNPNLMGISPSATSTPKRKRGYSTDSGTEREDYGWFEDFESPYVQKMLTPEYSKQPLQRALTLPAPAAEPPLYILESSLETQHLWYSTAGRRPKQPTHEREYYEKLWESNFEQSSVTYLQDPNLMKKTKGDIVPKLEIKGEVLYRGKSPFSNAVSKYFYEGMNVSVTLQMPFYRIFRALDGNIHAEYLIKVTIGGNAPVTFGIWKRHSDFCLLAKIVMGLDLKSGSRNIYKNAILSWQCVLQRKRWYRSLDKDYLALKCFLLERFLHDVLFESSVPGILNKFLGLET